jgi:hypothetical protein
MTLKEIFFIFDKIHVFILRKNYFIYIFFYIINSYKDKIKKYKKIINK